MKKIKNFLEYNCPFCYTMNKGGVTMGFFNDKNKLRQWLPAFIFVAGAIIFYKLVDWIPEFILAIGKFLNILSPFFIGFVIAVILLTPSKKLENLLNKNNNKFIKKYSRALSVAFTYLVFITLVLLAFSFVIPRLFDSIAKLIDSVPEYYNQVSNFFSSKMNAEGKIYGINVQKVLSLITPERVLSFFDVSSITPYIGKVFEFGSAIVTFFMSFIVSIYMLLARERLIKSFKTFISLFFSKKIIGKLSKFAVSACNIFNAYIYSQILDALILGVLMSIALTIVGLPYSLLFGILIGVFNLIPYFGAAISCIATIIFSMISQGFGKAVIVAIIILVIQQIDANILQPRIVGDSLGLHPFYVLLAITVGGGYFGFLGILIGVPIIAIIKLIINYIYEAKNMVPIKQESKEKVSEKDGV